MQFFRHGVSTLEYVYPANGVYAMIKEQCVAVPVDFHNKDITLEPFVAFHKSLAMACVETLEALKALKIEQKQLCVLLA
ncbi:hypothetical protein RMCBS344292_12890 [Rhizopus microsporus]|nr:hypothetical protein RMCBS344292_12890 [Rhizopus microsporus]